jgi:hypothetical protein
VVGKFAMIHLVRSLHKLIDPCVAPCRIRGNKIKSGAGPELRDDDQWTPGLYGIGLGVRWRGSLSVLTRVVLYVVCEVGGIVSLHGYTAMCITECKD